VVSYSAFFKYVCIKSPLAVQVVQPQVIKMSYREKLSSKAFEKFVARTFVALLKGKVEA